MNTLNTLPIDMMHVIRHLDRRSAASVPLLPESLRLDLLAEANTYKYVPQPEFVGKHGVREQLSSCTEILPPGSLFCKLKGQLNDEITRKAKDLGEESLFATSFRLNQIALQLYESGSIGITPHMDNKNILNIICLVILTGTSKFAICENREGNNPYYLDTTPGNVIFMRMVGYRGSDFRPMHFVTGITERRIVVGIRQIIKH
jgi:hypothetical protein